MQPAIMQVLLCNNHFLLWGRRQFCKQCSEFIINSEKFVLFD